jgi:photosystem II stability/assembly factor-like uncharacterized protein
LAHWTDITPPQSQSPVAGTYESFQRASFLNRTTGWVTSWNPATVRTTIYRSNDGGRTWTAIPGGGHSGNAGAASLVDLVSPTVAFEETLEPAGPEMSLTVTSDAAQTWSTVYTGPPPTIANGRYQGPFEMPMTFNDILHGFAAMDVPPVALLRGEADFFSTTDGGSTWQRRTPPLPDSPVTCPTSVLSTQPSACVYSLPSFSDTRHGTLGAVNTNGSHAYIAFDLTSDAGQRWTKASQVAVPVTPNPLQGGVQGSAAYGYPLISTESSTLWWVLGWSGSSATTEITTDQGASWSRVSAPIPSGDPTALAAIDGMRALLSIQDDTASGAITNLLTTANGGRTWTAINLAG